MDEDSNQQTPPKKRKKFGWNSPDHNPEEFRLSLVEHLEELRTRVIRSFLVVIGFWTLCWVKFDVIYNFLTDRAIVAVKAGLPKGAKFIRPRKLYVVVGKPIQAATHWLIR